MTEIPANISSEYRNCIFTDKGAIREYVQLPEGVAFVYIDGCWSDVNAEVFTMMSSAQDSNTILLAVHKNGSHVELPWEHIGDFDSKKGELALNETGDGKLTEFRVFRELVKHFSDFAKEAGLGDKAHNLNAKTSATELVGVEL